MKSRHSVTLFHRTVAWPALITLMSFSVTSIARAATYVWDADGSTSLAFGGTSSWDTSSSRWLAGDEYGSIGAWSNTPTDSTALFAGSAGSVTLGANVSVNQLRFNMTGYTLSGGNTLTLNGTAPTIFTSNGVSATIGNNTNITLAGSAGLTKQGAGTLTLNGNTSNTFTGGLTLKSGTLALDFSNFTTPTNLFDSGNALTLGGGRMTIAGKSSGTTSQAFDGTTLSAGGGSILVNPNGGTSTTVALGALTTSAAGGSLLVGTAASPGSGTVAITTTTNKDATTGIYSPRVVFTSDGGTAVDWATSTTSTGPTTPNTLSALSSYTTLPTTGGTSTVNYKMTAATTLGGNVAANTLKMENATGDLGINTRLLTVNSGGILITGTNARSITGSAGATRLTAGAGSDYNLTIQNHTIGISQTVSAVIGNNGSNPVSLTLAGAVQNLLVLSGVNTYTGATYINSGRVQAGAASSLGSGSAGVYVANGGQLFLSVGFNLTKPLEISGFGRADGGTSGAPVTQFGAVRVSTNTDLQGTVTLASDARIAKHNGGSATISGQISGGYMIDFQGSSQANSIATTIVLSNSTNNYTGDTSISHQDYNVTIPYTGGSMILKLGASNVVPNGAGKGNVVFNGTDPNHITILELNGNNETINGLKNLAASGALIRNNHASTASTLTVGDGNTSSIFSGSIVDGGAASLAISKTGTGKFTLAGTNTYTGATNVNSGTLEIGTGSSLAAGSAVTVSNTGSALIVNGTVGGTLMANANTTLSGSGTITGAATIQGVHSPGNSPGIQNFSSDLTYSGGASVVNWELSANTATQGSPTAVFDQVVVSGDLDFTDLTTLNLVFNAAGGSVAWGNEFWSSNRTWTIFDVAGTTTNLTNLTLASSSWLDSSSTPLETSRPDASFTLLRSGQDVILNYSAVPETSSALLASLGLLATLRRRRTASGH